MEIVGSYWEIIVDAHVAHKQYVTPGGGVGWPIGGESGLLQF